MRIEIGKFRLETGARGAVTPPPSLEDIEKAIDRRIGGADLTHQARQLSTTGMPLISASTGPNPGPLPPANEDVERSPRRWNYPTGYNAYQTPGRGKVAPFAILRQMSTVSDISRICIETRKDQMTSLGWDIVARDKKTKPSDQVLQRIATARQFFQKPDQRRSFSTWFRLAIEEVLVIDALSLYRRRTRKGDRIYSLEIIDGATIVPLIDETGDTPLPPNAAYRQIIMGHPVAGGDCTTEQLYYRPRTVRTDTPYGLSPMEAVLLTVNAALNRAVFNLAYFTEGNIPRGFMDAPENWTTKQIREFQEYFDEMMEGNLKSRNKLKIVGQNMAKSLTRMADPDFTTAFDEYLMKVNCAAFAVPPQEIGFTGDVNKATGEQQENIVYRRGVKPLGGFFKELFDEVLANDLDCPELEWAWSGGEAEDKKAQAETDKIYVDMGKVSIDELRARDGQDPIGVGPFINTPMGPVFIAELLSEPPDDDPDTTEVVSPANAAGQGNAGSTGEAEPNDAPPEAGDDVETEARKDLKAWQTVAIKAVRTNRTPRIFKSEALPASVKLEVRLGLMKAKTVQDVVAVFEKVRGVGRLVPEEAIVKAENRVFIGSARVTQTRLKKHTADFFKKQGAAFSQDLGTAIEDAL